MMRSLILYYWSLLKETANKWSADKSPRLGAALAFYSMLSIGPLLLLFVSGAALFYGQDDAQGKLLEQMRAMVGDDGARAVKDMLASAAEQKSTGIIASLFGLATLLVGASGVFGELQDALNGIWNVAPSKTGGVWLMVRRRLFSFSMVLVTGFLLLVSLAMSTLLAAFDETTADFIPGGALLMMLTNDGVSFAVITGLFAAIFKYLPDTDIRWREVWLGAAITAALFTLGKFAIGLYLGHSAMSSAYGAGGSLVVLLVWVYYSAQILFFGAEFTQVHTMRQRAKK